MRVRVVVPEGFDNPGQPTGGNTYDRRICAGLAEAGWDVQVTTVAAAWPAPGPGARADLARIVSAIPDGETVLIDGLVASPAAAPLLPHTVGYEWQFCCTCHWSPSSTHALMPARSAPNGWCQRPVVAANGPASRC